MLNLLGATNNFNWGSYLRRSPLEMNGEIT